MRDKNMDEDFKRIGYKISFSAWVLLMGSIMSLIIAIYTIVSEQGDYISYVAIFSLLAVIFFVSFVIEKKRPDVVVYLSDTSLKIYAGFKWEIIPLGDIDCVDYRLNVLKRTQSILFDAGCLIIECKAKKFVVRDIEYVRDCYEKIAKAKRNLTTDNVDNV